MAPHLREEVCKIAREEKLQPVLPGEAFECGQVDEVLLTVIDRLIQAEAVPDTERRCGVETFRRVARVEIDLVSAVPEGELGRRAQPTHEHVRIGGRPHKEAPRLKLRCNVC